MSGPRCPNHQVPMHSTGEARIWKCPISGALFEADADESKGKKEYKLDLSGKMVPKTTWILKPMDGKE